jgi:ribose-phosphate pyrophosphokinase
MKPIIFSLPGNEYLATSISEKLCAEKGDAIIHQFPDSESHVRIFSDVKEKEVVVVCTLNRPDEKLLPLYFFCKGLKEFGASHITLISPYLAYMRQDKRFNEGEVITSEYFAKLISSFADLLITIDPHLHRRHSMSEIYSIPCEVLHASMLISDWIKENIENPLLIGPDSESEQWVSEVAKNADAPFLVLEKTRLGDNEVKVTVPNVEKYKNHTPVLVDDIISTARTMIETVSHLNKTELKASVCIGIHPVFAGDAYQELKKSGVGQIVTCNAIYHNSNRIDISDLIVKALKKDK